MTDTVPGQPGRQGVLLVGQVQRARGRRLRLDLTAQRVERGELPGRDLLIGEMGEGREQRLARGLQLVDRPGGGGGRVVDLVRQARRELAQRDEGITLPRR